MIINGDYINPKSNFKTFQMNLRSADNYINASHIYVADKESREVMADDIFEILNYAYDEIGGFKSFKDMAHFIDDSYLWYVTYDGEQPEDDNLDINKVLAVSVFRQSHGLKMVGMAANRFPYFSKGTDGRNSAKMRAKSAIDEHIRFVANRGWAEVSGRLESAFQKSLPWGKYVIMPDFLIEHKIFRNITLDVDGVHYFRPLRAGEDMIRKIAFGTIKL